MFIAIYGDGNPVTKPDLDSAFSLPGNYYVFSCGATLQVNSEDGVLFYNKDKKVKKFKIKNLELINIEKINNNNNTFLFSIHDNQSDSVKLIYTNYKLFEYALGFLVNTIIIASLFPNWETYESVTKIKEHRSEITSLKELIQKLNKRNEQLENSLKALQKPTS